MPGFVLGPFSPQWPSGTASVFSLLSTWKDRICPVLPGLGIVSTAASQLSMQMEWNVPPII